MENSPNLDLPYIAAAQAQKHVTHNEAIRILDAIIHLCVLDRDLATPPQIAHEGDRYIVGAGASGPWTGKEDRVAVLQDGGWVFHSPTSGWLAWVMDEARLVAWDGAAWTNVATQPLGSTPSIGINATADQINRLAVSSPASLFNHDGEGHQIKINKAAAADTASLLYQSGFSGHAEMGLTGDNDFHVKVSSDGAAWNEAMVIDAESGRLGVGTGAPDARVHCRVSSADRGCAFLMTGKGITGADDPDHGAVLVLTHNMAGNRQFVLGDSETGAGIRVIGSALDGFDYHASERRELRLGTESHGVAVAGPLRAAQWMRAGSFPKTALPAPANAGAGAIIYVPDEAAGATLAFCDGAQWRRIWDRSVVS